MTVMYAALTNETMVRPQPSARTTRPLDGTGANAATRMRTPSSRTCQRNPVTANGASKNCSVDLSGQLPSLRLNVTHGSRAATMLVELVDAPWRSPAFELVEPTLVVRSTTGPVPVRSF